jgi:Zn-dependent protease with chaperone function
MHFCPTVSHVLCFFLCYILHSLGLQCLAILVLAVHALYLVPWPWDRGIALRFTGVLAPASEPTLTIYTDSFLTFFILHLRPAFTFSFFSLYFFRLLSKHSYPSCSFFFFFSLPCPFTPKWPLSQGPIWMGTILLRMLVTARTPPYAVNFLNHSAPNLLPPRSPSPQSPCLDGSSVIGVGSF